jgi:predicted transcriptional regulator YdeE
MKLIERETFYICGYAVETNSEQNETDVAGLYEDFFSTDKESTLRDLQGSKNGYYGLLWYTQNHEKYFYLLGIEVAKDNMVPENALTKTLEKTIFAVAEYPAGKDGTEAWTEFFYTDIPEAGYAPNEQYNLYFEYYPKSVNGNYELWVPVIK